MAAVAVGIDLGTTYSAVPWVDASGRTAMIENAEGDVLTPSVVLFGDSQVTVGKEARSAATVSPDQVAEWVKRDMGAPAYHRPIRGEYLPPEVIQACILRKLRSDIDRVLLVGGSTRMPAIPRMLEELTGKRPERTVNPDEAVARGAALYARYLLAKEEKSAVGFELTNVNSHSLGVKGIDPATMRKTHVVLIPRNTPLPATFTEKFVTKRAGQESIVIQVLEGESSLPSECTVIGRTVVRGLPPDLPQGWTVEVTFEYAANGRLGVRAVVPGTHQETVLTVDRAVGLSEAAIAGWKQTVGSSPGFSAFGTMMEDPVHRSTGHEAAEAGGGPAAPQTPAPSPPPPDSPVPVPPRVGKRRRLVYAMALALAALVGLVAGYLLVCHLYPEAGFPTFW